MQTLGQWPVHRCYIGQKQLSLSLSRQSQTWEHQPHGLWVLGDDSCSKWKTQGWGKLFVKSCHSFLKQISWRDFENSKEQEPPKMRWFYCSSENNVTSTSNLWAETSLFQGQTFPSNTPTVLIVLHTCRKKSPVFGAPTFQQPACSPAACVFID